MDKHFCILFSGPIGCSKTPIANFLSTELNLPVLCNDVMRTETTENNDGFDQIKYENLRDSRLQKLFERKLSFIYDASIDRDWLKLKEWLHEFNYNYFVISIDVTEKFLRHLYELKQYHESLSVIGRSLNDHDNFIKKFGEEIGACISEKDFSRRLEVALEAVKIWLKK